MNTFGKKRWYIQSILLNGASNLFHNNMVSVYEKVPKGQAVVSICTVIPGMVSWFIKLNSLPYLEQYHP